MHGDNDKVVKNLSAEIFGKKSPCAQECSRYEGEERGVRITEYQMLEGNLPS